ncbi:MAG: CarD family transcriptional regulator [Caldilineaceae bacterium]
MDFAIGQHIIHPSHGPGEIIDIEEQTLIKKKGVQEYYVIRFANKRLVVRVPKKDASERGLREVMSPAKSKQVFSALRGAPQDLPQDFKERRKQIEEMIFSGAPIRIAEAVRELTWRGHEKNLNISDQKLLEQGREMLIDELCLATDAEPATVNDTINEALTFYEEALLAV